MTDQYKRIVLDNGLRLLTHSMPGRNSFSFGVWITVGGRYERLENKGISHFLEHLLFKGSKRYSCSQIKESIEGIGGTLNAFTSEELTCVLAKVPAEHADTAIAILSDMAINPLLSEEDVEKERTVILEEIKMYRDLPQSYVYELLDELMWPNHPLGLAVIGCAESVSGLKRDTIRSFKEEHYTPLNMVVSACGAIEQRELEAKVRRVFSKLSPGKIRSFAAAGSAQDKPQLKIFAKETEQTHLALGFHSLKRDHPLRHALGFLHIIMGANMSSRLFNEVREKRGLAYEIGSAVKRFKDTGAFIVHAGLDCRKLSEALDLILLELGKAKHELVSPGEFKRAKDFYIGQLELALEDTMEHMLWIGEAAASLDKTYSLKQIIKEIRAVTREDLRTVARQLFVEKNMNLALIGPLGSQEEIIYNQLKIS
jgi:predicted Zn-dependent peptidase